MRAAAARACRNPSKPIGFSTFSTSHVNKTYENTTLSHRKILKFCSRALAGSFKNQWFFNIYVTRRFAGNFSRARRIHSTTSARAPEAQSLSNNAMRATCARPPRAHAVILLETVVAAMNSRSTFSKTMKDAPNKKIKSQWFFQHLCHTRLRGQLLARTADSFNNVRARARGTIPVK